MPLKTPRQWCAKIDINLVHRKISDVVKRKIKTTAFSSSTYWKLNWVVKCF